MRSRISLETGGLPGLRVRPSLVQCSRNFLRLQATEVDPILWTGVDDF